jgi:uncharacterized membrane protein
MKRTRVLIVSALLTSALAATAYAAMPHPLAFAPPSASELGLEASHTDTWNALREETLSLRESAREEVRSTLEHADALLADDNADLAALSQSIDSAVDDTLARSRALRDRKLAFYQTLGADEQRAVRSAMRSRLERAQRLRAAFATVLQDAY